MKRVLVGGLGDFTLSIDGDGDGDADADIPRCWFGSLRLVVKSLSSVGIQIGLGGGIIQVYGTLLLDRGVEQVQIQ